MERVSRCASLFFRMRASLRRTSEMGSLGSCCWAGCWLLCESRRGLEVKTCFMPCSVQPVYWHDTACQMRLVRTPPLTLRSAFGLLQSLSQVE